MSRNSDAIAQDLLPLCQRIFASPQACSTDAVYPSDVKPKQINQFMLEANRLGYTITPRMLFAHLSVDALADALAQQRHRLDSDPAEALKRQAIGAQTVLPLLPYQRWFLENHQGDLQQYNTRCRFFIKETLHADILRQAVYRVVEQHDALRASFVLSQGVWQQKIRPHANADCMEEINLPAVGLSDGQEAEQQALQQIDTSLDLASSALFKVVLVNFEKGGEQTLSFIWHRLIMDKNSRGIVVNDVRSVYYQLLTKTPVTLLPQATSLLGWVNQLPTFANGPELRAELAYWRAQAQGSTLQLPIDNHVKAIEKDKCIVSVALSKENTRQLKTYVNTISPQREQWDIYDVLYSVLVQAFNERYGQSANGSVSFWVDAHGREDWLRDNDLSRTVGQFAMPYPLCLHNDVSGSWEARLNGIKQQLQALPTRGFSYSLFRYWHENQAIRDEFEKMPLPYFRVRYHGDIDAAVEQLAPRQEQSNAPWVYDLNPKQPFSYGEQLSRLFALDFHVFIQYGQLGIDIEYNTQQIPEGEVQAVGALLVDNLQQLLLNIKSIDHR